MAHGGGSTQADILGYDKSSKMQDAGGLQSSSSHPSSGLVGHLFPSPHDRDTGSLVFTTCPTSRASSVLLLLSYPEISAWSHSNERIVQPRESKIEHIVSMAFTEFFSVEGLRPKILPLMERSHHHHRQLTYRGLLEGVKRSQKLADILYIICPHLHFCGKYPLLTLAACHTDSHRAIYGKSASCG